MTTNDYNRKEGTDDDRLPDDTRERVAERAPYATGHHFVFGAPRAGEVEAATEADR